MLILKDKKRKDLKTGVISLVVSLMILGQTTNTSSIDLTVWFSGFLPLVVHLFMAFAIIMFIYAIVEAPLEIFKRRSVSLSLLTFLFLLGQTTTTTDHWQELVSKAMQVNNALTPIIASLLVVLALIAIPILVLKVIASDIFDIIKK